jgi:hypothetical protein
MLFSVHTQEVQRVNMDEDPPMDGVCEEAETGGDTLGFPFSLSLSLSQTSSRKLGFFLSFRLLRLREAGE